MITYHPIQRALKVLILRHLVALPKQRVGVLSKKLRRTRRLVTSRLVLVNEVAASLIQRGDETGLSLERAVDSLGVLRMYFE